MGNGPNKLADIPGNRFTVTMDIASVASNGAASKFVMFNAEQNIQIEEAKWLISGGDQLAGSASYRKLSILDGGSDGTGTTEVSSLNLSSVSKASLGQAAFSGTATIAAGNQVLFSQATVGGAHSDGTVLIAGRVQVEYRLL